MSDKTSPSYKELLESVTKYNSRLLVERRGRIPYHDPSSNLPYQDGRRLFQSADRNPGQGTGQIITYPSRRWKVKPRPLPPPVPVPAHDVVNPCSSLESADQSNGTATAAAGISSNGVTNGVGTDSNTVSSALKMFEDSFTSSRDSWSQPEMMGETIPPAEESESNEPDFDTDEDYDDGSSQSAKKKRGPAKGSTKNCLLEKMLQGPGKARKDIDYTVVVGSEKPYACNYCDMTYKTRPGLTYHVTKEHPNGKPKGFGGAVPPSLPGPPPVFPHQPFQPPSHFAPPQFPFQSAQKMAILSNPNADLSIQRDQDGRSMVCDFCEAENATGTPAPKGEKLITCASCGHSAHPTCLGFSKNQRESTRRYPWKCIECKSCAFCNSAENDEKLLFCDDCDRGYHMYCLSPPLESTPEGLWSCAACLAHYGEEAAFRVWSHKVQQEAVAKYQREMEDSARRPSSSNNSRQKFSVQM